MSDSQRVVLIATAAAGTLVLLILGLTTVEIAGCHRQYLEYGGLDLCDLGWFIGGALCVLVGIVWLIVMTIVAITALVRRHRGS